MKVKRFAPYNLHLQVPRSQCSVSLEIFFLVFVIEGGWGRWWVLHYEGYFILQHVVLCWHCTLPTVCVAEYVLCAVAIFTATVLKCNSTKCCDVCRTYHHTANYSKLAEKVVIVMVLGSGMPVKRMVKNRAQNYAYQFTQQATLVHILVVSMRY